jgi:hypothetical protein
MTRQLKVDGELDYLLTVIKRAVPVAEGVRTVSDHAGGYFTLLIKGQMVPDEWVTAAFALSARRHDFGNGREAFMAWVFPISAAPKINAKFPVLNAYLQANESVLTYNTNKPPASRKMPAGAFA